MKPALSRFLRDLDGRDEERRNYLIKTLKPPQFDEEEEKRLKEKDRVWKKEVLLINRCSHEQFIIHSNGTKECLSKYRKLWVPERLRDLYPSKTYPNAVFVEEVSND